MNSNYRVTKLMGWLHAVTNTNAPYSRESCRPDGNHVDESVVAAVSFHWKLMAVEWMQQQRQLVWMPSTVVPKN